MCLDNVLDATTSVQFVPVRPYIKYRQRSNETGEGQKNTQYIFMTSFKPEPVTLNSNPNPDLNLELLP